MRAVDFKRIVLKGEGHQIEPVLATGVTPKPGQCITINSSGEAILHTSGATGNPEEVIVVVENNLVGKTIDDAYVAGDKALAYIPQAGDELQVLVKSGENIAVGDIGIIETTSGKTIKLTGTPVMRPFKFLEGSGGALGADGLLRVRRI